MVKHLICVIVLFWAVSNVYSASVKEDYESQEKCGKKCEDIFKKEYGTVISTRDEQMLNNYQSHYSKKLNKCFILLTSTIYPKDKTVDVFYMKLLFDVNDKKEYGSFDKFRKDPVPLSCYVSGKRCVSEQEWDLLAKPYMEN